MKQYRRIATLTAACLMLCVLFMTGCEQEKVYVPITANTIEITKDGSLVAYMVEDFDKDYYDVTELESMLRSELEVYNKNKASLAEGAGRVPVLVDKVIMAEDGSAKVVVGLNFANAAVYEDYMGKELFYGSVTQAVTAGYQLNGKLTAVKNNASFGTEEIMKHGEKTIIIVEDAVTIRTNNKVQYLSTNASLTEDGYVDGASEELKYIITK